MDRLLVAIFTCVFLTMNAGCAAVSYTVSSIFPICKEEQYHHAGQYQECIREITGPRGLFHNEATPRKIVAENIQLIRRGDPTNIDFLRYRFDLEFLIDSYLEIGQLHNASILCDAALAEFRSLTKLANAVRYKYMDHLTVPYMKIALYKAYIVWFETGDSQKVLSYFNESTSVAMAVGSENKTPPKDPIEALFSLVDSALMFAAGKPEVVAKMKVMTGMAAFYSQIMGDYPKALNCLDMVLKQADSLTVMNIDHKYAALLETYRSIMLINMNFGNLQLAKETLDKYESCTKATAFKAGKTLMSQSPVFAGYLSAMDSTAGALFALLRDFEKSKEYFDRAHKIISKINPDSTYIHDQNALATYYVYYGAYYQGLKKNYREATQNIGIGIKHLRPGYINSIASDVTIETAYYYLAEASLLSGDAGKAIESAKTSIHYSERYHNKVGIMQAKILLGAIYYRSGKQQKAMDELKSANSLCMGVENSEKWKLYFYLGKLYEDAGNRDRAIRYYKSAVDEVEKLWSGRLRDVRKQVSLIDERLIAFEPLIKSLCARKRSAETINYIERSKARTFFDNMLYENDPEAAERGKLSSKEPLTSEQIRQIIPPKFVILEYYVGTEAVVGAAISNEGVTAKNFPLSSDDLKNKIFTFRRSIHSKTDSNGEMSRMGQELLTLLVKPFNGKLVGCETICIIPHGVLHYLPFQALVTGSTPIDADYLSEKYRIFYAPSATILAAVHERNTGKKLRLLAAAPKFDNLSYNLEEAEKVSSFFTDRVVLKGNDATVAKVQSNLSRCDIGLLSTHGSLDLDQPLKSHILLAKDGNNDGRLTMAEIERSKLACSLVVLSACQSGIVSGFDGGASKLEEVRLPNGDDLIGLQRSFMRSGAASVLSTLWSVNDKSTEELMVEFFKRYTAGEDKATALQHAQIAIMQMNNQWQKPYYWAPFILSGDWE